MKRLWLTLAIIGATAITQAQYSQGGMPAFHENAPAKGQALPPVLTEQQLVNAGFTDPLRKESYKAAAKMSGVMYQMPCYCSCDVNFGHKSLRSCFEGDHGAACGICMGEALYVYKMSKKGWTPKMIRDGIARGDYKMMDLQHPEPVI